jgi:thiol-disulfide isomerase/thioredoxin
MRKRFTLAILILGFLTAPIQILAQEAKIEPPKVLALLFYADWCNSCKVLEPKLNQVKRDFQDQSILFTRFDLTDDFTKDQAAHYAALLGLEDVYHENAKKTGFVLLIDWPSKKVLGKITKEKSPEEIKSMLTHAQMGHPVGD